MNQSSGNSIERNQAEISVYALSRAFWRDCLPRLAYNNRHIEFDVETLSSADDVKKDDAETLLADPQVLAAFRVVDGISHHHH